MAKHRVLALNVNDGIVEINGKEYPMKLPKGCEGFCFVFDSKKAAREYWGNDVPLARIKYKQNSNLL
jgi:hypothetical protein